MYYYLLKMLSFGLTTCQVSRELRITVFDGRYIVTKLHTSAVSSIRRYNIVTQRRATTRTQELTRLCSTSLEPREQRHDNIVPTRPTDRVLLCLYH